MMADAWTGRSCQDSVFARLVCTLLILVFAMELIGNQGQVEAGRPRDDRGEHNHNQRGKMGQVQRRLKRLENIVHALAHQECQAGVVDFQDCPGFKENSTSDIAICVVSPQAGDGASIMDFSVTFAKSFRKPPVVDVSFSGLAILGGKNATVQALNVTSEQFVIQQVADDFLPIATKVTYYACPAAFFDHEH